MKQIKRNLSKMIELSKYDKIYDKRKELMDILREGERKGKEQGNQNCAINALKEFHNRLKSAKNQKQYIAANGSHLSYLFLIVKVKEAFMKSDYIWACHELCNIIHSEDIFQNRIKNNVLALIDEYIEVG